MCFLVNGAVECTNSDDRDQVIYQELAKGGEMAAYRFYVMTDGFATYQQPYELIEIGCVEIKEDS